MKKKIIFFDGDGTLWYPKATKYKKGPWWVYYDKKTNKDPNKHMILTPTTLTTLKKLKKLGIYLVILSTHPHPPKEADAIIKGKVKHFDLHKLFDEVHATREYHGSKGKVMVKILKRLNIRKSKALMVGDMYDWDYKPAREKGIEALLITSNYGVKHIKSKRVSRKIKKLNEIFNYL